MSSNQYMLGEGELERALRASHTDMLEKCTNLVECLRSLPRDEERGMRFIGLRGEEHYFSFHALEMEAYGRGKRLRERGLKQGDRVVLVLPEGHDFVPTFFACVVAGIVPVPVSPRPAFKYKEAYRENLRHVAEASGAKGIITEEATAKSVEMEALDKPAGLEWIEYSATLFEGLEPSESDVVPLEIAPDSICFLQFTSGSTRKPKGVSVSHSNLLANTRCFLGAVPGVERTPSDLGVSWLPLFHDMGLIGFVMASVVCDFPVVLMATEAFARMPRLWLELIAKYKATITYAPNFAYELVTKRVRDRDLEKLDLSSLRIAGCGAEPIRARTFQRFTERFASAGFQESCWIPSYGMAEATLAITMQNKNKPWSFDRVDSVALQEGHAKPASDSQEENVSVIVACGEPYPEHEVEVRNEEGDKLPDRMVGEVVTRGPSVTSGYFNLPEATAEAFQEGWLHTGDLGYFVDGQLHICGRKKDLIIINGANHYPHDIEWSVGDMEGVRRGNVVAFSVTHEESEALVVIAESNSPDAERLKKEIPDEVAKQHGLSPIDVALVPLGTIPKTSSGKPQRSKTRTLYEGKLLQRHA